LFAKAREKHMNTRGEKARDIYLARKMRER